MSEPLRLMCVHAHPDDESSKGAATMARYVAEGAEVLVVSCTGGERGDVLNPALKDDAALLRDMPRGAPPGDGRGRAHPRRPARVARLRRLRPARGRPAAAAARGLLRRWSRCDTAAEPLVRLVRAFRPHVMTTYDENGGYPHPDHIMCHKVSMEAFDAAADPERYPHAGEPWQVSKIYYNQTFTRSRVVAFHEALLAEGHRVAVRRVAGELGGRPAPGAHHHHADRVRRVLRPCATRRCWRTPPRSTPTGVVLPGPARDADAGSGRPRTSSWPRARRGRAAGGRPVRRGPRARGRVISAQSP